MNGTDRNTTNRARRLRRSTTEAERMLWARLRSRQLQDLSFRRQHPIGPYIVDFVCLARKLIIEIDGGQHQLRTMKGADDRRAAWLRLQGFRILRFWNNEVLAHTDAVVERIFEALE